jgi:hypothetical protein
MSQWVPPYLGTWDKLIAMLLNNPFLGSGQDRDGLPSTHAPAPWRHGPAPLPLLAAEPDPLPWRSESIVKATASYLISLLATRHVASGIPDERVKEEVIRGVDHTIALIDDEICPRPPRPPWPPHQRMPDFEPEELAAGVVAELVLQAEVLRTPALREAVYEQAGLILERSVRQVLERG